MQHKQHEGSEPVQGWWHEQAEKASPVKQTETRLEVEAAHEIIARAAELQAKHRQTLGVTEIEAIAAEVGVDAAFVRQAMSERSTSGAVTSAATTPTVLPLLPLWMQRLVLVIVSLFYGLFLASLVRTSGSDVWIPVLFFGVPWLLGMAVGGLTTDNVRGAKYGALLTAIAGTLMLLSESRHGYGSLPFVAYAYTAIIVAESAAGGAIGGFLTRRARTRSVSQNAPRVQN